MKKSTATLLIASLTLLISGCGSNPKEEPLTLKPNDTNLDQLGHVITWTNSYGDGYRFDLDPTSDDWVRKFVGSPGKIDEVDSAAYEFKFNIDGQDWRHFFQNPICKTPYIESDAFKERETVDYYAYCTAEKDGIKVTFDLPYFNDVRIRIENKSQSEIPIQYTLPTALTVVSRAQQSPVDLNTEVFQDGAEQTLSPGETFVLNIYDSWLAGADMAIFTSKPPIRLTGPGEDVTALNGLWYRFSGATATENYPLGPFGATSPRFNGHVFWDADIWWFPALALTNPKAATQIPSFRYQNLDEARSYAANWAFDKARPTGNNQELGKIETGSHIDAPTSGAKFPWESDSNGVESSPTETVFQDHLSASVAFMMQQALALNLDQNADLQKPQYWQTLIPETEDFYRLRRHGNELHHTVSPSEWHTVNNDLYTNALLEVVYGFDMKLPRDETTFLTFDDDKLREYQQAAALLAVYPLQHPEVEAEADKMLARFKDKAAKQGPAMSHSINATIAARLGQTELAYEEWQKSWRNYTDDPWLNFREKPKYGDSYFYTGAAGCLNAVYYGFMGLRLDRQKPTTPKPWMIPLKNGWWLSADPHLPKEWTKLELDIEVLQKRYTLIATQDGLKVQDRQ